MHVHFYCIGQANRGVCRFFNFDAGAEFLHAGQVLYELGVSAQNINLFASRLDRYDQPLLRRYVPVVPDVPYSPDDGLHYLNLFLRIGVCQLVDSLGPFGRDQGIGTLRLSYIGKPARRGYLV